MVIKRFESSQEYTRLAEALEALKAKHPDELVASLADQDSSEVMATIQEQENRRQFWQKKGSWLFTVLLIVLNIATLVCSLMAIYAFQAGNWPLAVGMLGPALAGLVGLMGLWTNIIRKVSRNNNWPELL